jgi:hypothetical protein
MTANDFKTLVSRELEGLPPMPSVVADVLAEGARRQRRRRMVGTGLAVASIISVVAVGATVLPKVTESESPGSSNGRPVPSVANQGPVTDSRDEFTQWAARKFSEVLPQRFGPVQPTGQYASFATHVGEVEIEFNLVVSLTDWAHSNVEPEDVNFTANCADAGDTCVDSPAQNAIAYHDTTDDAHPYAGMEMFVVDRTDAADEVDLNFFGERHSGTPVPLTDHEILTLAESPQFEQIWHEVTAHPDWVSSGRILSCQTRRC